MLSIQLQNNNKSNQTWCNRKTQNKNTKICVKQTKKNHKKTREYNI